MIKIIAGIYGYKNPATGSVEAKTAKSAPFSCTPSEEERLVNLGVAAYEGAPPTPDTDPDADPDNDNDEGDEVKLENLTKKQLLAIANQIGISVPNKATNPEIIALIEKAQGEHDAEGDGQSGSPNTDPDADPDDDGDEGAPDLSAAMPE
jgi:hypothetical protein